MCACAGQVARGELPGSCSDENARRFARAARIQTELLEHAALDVVRAAAALCGRCRELAAAAVRRLTGSPRESDRPFAGSAHGHGGRIAHCEPRPQQARPLS